MRLSNFKIKETITEPFSTKQKKSLLLQARILNLYIKLPPHRAS